MDPFNPIIAERYVKRVSWWQVYAAEAFGVVLVVTLVWFVSAVVLSFGGTN